MADKPNGGPAFPVTDTHWNTDREEWEVATFDPGMTLRDYFAAKAMQGWLASFAGIQDAPMSPELAAERAYHYADAMLQERDK